MKGQTGTPTCPVSSPPTGDCDVGYETTWIWQGDYWNQNAVVESIVQSLQLAKNDVRDTAGNIISSSDPSYCKNACESGSLAFCTFATVPNGVSTGLLSTITNVAASNTGNRTIAIADIVTRFGVSGGSSALKACPRQDLVINYGNVYNYCQQCSTITNNYQPTILRFVRKC
jgi:hypothetical protein